MNINFFDIDFPHGKFSKHFLLHIIIKKLTNWEKNKRWWLIYFKDSNRVFCFCCKLFNSFSSTKKLTREGSKDRKNFNAKLKHKIGNEYIINMRSWIDLEMKLLKNKTIDKNV